MTPIDFLHAIEDAEERGDTTRVKELCDAFDAAYPKDYYMLCEEYDVV